MSPLAELGNEIAEEQTDQAKRLSKNDENKRAAALEPGIRLPWEGKP